MITDQQLRTLYLADLTNPDIHHGRTAPKVRNLQPWKTFTPVIKNETIEVNPYTRNVWVWSDIHWGHKNIIKYTAPCRPFDDVIQMNEALTANYMNVVGPDDIVIFGGDIGFMPIPRINAILNSLPGYKIGIVGNHDIDRQGRVYELDFDEHLLCRVVNVVDPEDNFTYQLLFTHYPMDSVPPGCHNIHGHIHQHTANEWNTNICVEHTGCAPINLLSLLPSIKTRIK